MAEATTTEAAAKGGGRMKLVVILGVVVVVALAAVYVLVLAPKGDVDPSMEPTEGAAMFATEPGAILPVADTTVSLGGSEPHFAALSYSVVLSADVADSAPIEATFDRLRSRAQMVFRGYEAAYLNSPEGFQQLQGDLTAVARELWPDGEVIEVLVTSLLVQ